MAIFYNQAKILKLSDELVVRLKQVPDQDDLMCRLIELGVSINNNLKRNGVTESSVHVLVDFTKLLLIPMRKVDGINRVITDILQATGPRIDEAAVAALFPRDD